MRRRHPELRLRLHEGRAAELVALLRRGDLDLLVVALEAPLEGLATRPLAACQARGADEIGDFRASSLSTLVEMVSGGEGVTLLPELTVAVEARRRDLALVPFAAPAPFRTIGLAWRAASRRTAEYGLLAESLTPIASTARTKPRGRIARK